MTNNRKQLNNSQAEVLYLLYKFRFATSDQIARYFGKKNGSRVYKRLKILCDQGFAARRYDGYDRIHGRPVLYYLRPLGLKELNQYRATQEKALLTASWLKKEKSVSSGFRSARTVLFDMYLDLRAQFGGSLQFFTSNQIAKGYDYFSEFVPEAYFKLADASGEHDYFLEYFQSSKPAFTFARRIHEYVDYADSGEWESGTGSKFPAVLIVCDTKRLEARLYKNMAYVLNDADDDLKIYVSTVHAVGEWRDLSDADAEAAQLLTI